MEPRLSKNGLELCYDPVRHWWELYEVRSGILIDRFPSREKAITGMDLAISLIAAGKKPSRVLLFDSFASLKT